MIVGNNVKTHQNTISKGNRFRSWWLTKKSYVASAVTPKGIPANSITTEIQVLFENEKAMLAAAKKNTSAPIPHPRNPSNQPSKAPSRYVQTTAPIPTTNEKSKPFFGRALRSVK